MKHWLIFALIAGTFGANAAAPVFSANGLDPVKIGDTIARLGIDLRQRVDVGAQGDSCVLFSTRDGENFGISYLISDRVLARINVDYYGTSTDPTTIRTAEGIGLGSTEEDVMKAYGARVRAEPDTGDPTWHYLYVDDPASGRGLRFDTDGKKVTSMHAGQYPELKGGC